MVEEIIKQRNEAKREILIVKLRNLGNHTNN